MASLTLRVGFDRVGLPSGVRGACNALTALLDHPEQGNDTVPRLAAKAAGCILDACRRMSGHGKDQGRRRYRRRDRRL
jgi:hypothetical protein